MASSTGQIEVGVLQATATQKQRVAAPPGGFRVCGDREPYENYY